MTVRLKNFVVEQAGMEFGIRDADDKFLGDLVIKPNGMIWCQGKTSPRNGKNIDWAAFIKFMEGRP